jgi:hydroxymethylglutaryl-CoA reductase
VCSRDTEAAVEEEEEIAQVASTLARANESRSLIAWMKLIKEEELYLSVNLPG